MKKHLFILIFFAAIISHAQNQPLKRTCGTETPSNEWNEWFNNKVVEFKKNSANQKDQNANYTIPVIFHVIHGGQSVGAFPNISQAQINSNYYFK